MKVQLTNCWNLLPLDIRSAETHLIYTPFEYICLMNLHYLASYDVREHSSALLH